MSQMQVTVPAGVGPGMPFLIDTPYGQMQVTCPQGVTAGGQMLVHVPAAQLATVQAVPAGAELGGVVMGMVLPDEPVVAPVPMQMQTTNEQPKDGDNGQVFMKDIAGTYANPSCASIQRLQIHQFGVGEHAFQISYLCGIPHNCMVACRVPNTNCWFTPYPFGIPFRGYNKDGKTGIYICCCEDGGRAEWVKVDGPYGGRKPESH